MYLDEHGSYGRCRPKKYHCALIIQKWTIGPTHVNVNNALSCGPNLHPPTAIKDLIVFETVERQSPYNFGIGDLLL